MGLSRHEYYAVVVRGSRYGASQAASLADQPFALLCPGKVGGMSELLVLPYNYPQLFSLLKHVRANHSIVVLFRLVQERKAVGLSIVWHFPPFRS